MGTMVDMVSQYEVADMYSQINYKEKPVRLHHLNMVILLNGLLTIRRVFQHI